MMSLSFRLTFPDSWCSLDNWQTALRKQYWKRDPYANPIGREPTDAPNNTSSSSRLNSVTDDAHTDSAMDTDAENGDVDENAETEEINEKATKTLKAMQRVLTDEQIAELDKQESRDWFDLSMLEKLDCMHLLTEWLFQIPNRVRSAMRSDDDNAEWVRVLETPQLCSLSNTLCFCDV